MLITTTSKSPEKHHIWSDFTQMVYTVTCFFVRTHSLASNLKLRYHEPRKQHLEKYERQDGKRKKKKSRLNICLMFCHESIRDSGKLDSDQLNCEKGQKKRNEVALVLSPGFSSAHAINSLCISDKILISVCMWHIYHLGISLPFPQKSV